MPDRADDGRAEAERANLVARIFPAAELVDEAVKIGAKIATQSRIACVLAKRSVNAAFETTLTQGVATERGLFLSLFGTADHGRAWRRSSRSASRCSINDAGPFHRPQLS
ncbi:MAG: enoyl-CoA hydratase-related protein [Acetobacteraceae bacterium]